MKKLIVILIVLTPLIALSQANPFGAYKLNNVTMSSGTLYVYGDTITAPSSPSTPDNISGTAQVNLTGAQQVSLLPGFYGNAFTGTGNFIGQIGTGSAAGPITNAEVMGTSNEGNQYERFEIGINI